MRYLIAIALLALSGCAALVGNLPTMQYCDKVTYVRNGNQIKMTAECAAPIGGGSLPVPLPAGL